MRTIEESQEEMGIKEHPSGSKKLDVAAIEDPVLVNTVQARLDNLNAITGRVKGKNPAEPDDDVTDPTSDDDLDGDNLDDGDDDDPKASDDDSDDSTPASKKKSGEQIPDLYVRAAKGNGWSDEDIEEFVKASPERALKTFENIYHTWNKASKEFAANGRVSRKPVEEVKPKEVAKLEYGGIDIRKLEKEFDLDPAVRKMLEGANDRDEKLTDTLNQLIGDRAAPAQDTSRVNRAVKGYDVATEAAEEQMINGFFAADDMQHYNGFYGELRYGESWQNLPPTQQRNRYAVYEAADVMLAGAQMTGYPMQLTEALERAHLLITEGMREEEIRSDIKRKVTKRKNSIVFRPSDSKSKDTTGGGKTKTKGQLEALVATAISKAKRA